MKAPLFGRRANRVHRERPRFALPLLAGVLSGAAGLAYEVLWFRCFAITFGASARSAAVVLAALFLGSAIGARLIGPLADRVRAPLVLYAALEAGIAVGALVPVAARETIAALYARGVGSLGHGSPYLSWLGLGLAAAAMLPATVAMGASLPALVRGSEDPVRPGLRTAVIYGAQLAGAALGALLAAFVAYPALGARRALACAMLSSLLASAAALAAAGRERGHPVTRLAAPSATPPPHWRLLALAAASGALLVGLETLWVRLLALVLPQEVCCFAAMLFTVLVGLAIGSGLAALVLRRSRAAAEGALPVLLSLAGLAVFASPAVLYAIPHFRLFDVGRTGLAHALAVMGLSSAVLLLPCALAGAVLPVVLGVLERSTQAASLVLGRALAWNAIAAAAGAVVASELLLPRLTVHGAILCLGCCYGSLALLALGASRSSPRSVVAPSLAVLTVVLGSLLAAHVVPRGDLPEGVVYERYTPSGVLRVLETSTGRVMTLDTYYTLGGTRTREAEARQMDLPLSVHPCARDVACIGLATGSTAAAALKGSTRSLTVYEIVPEVIEAAALFPDGAAVLADHRTRLVRDDGRLALNVESREYDVIVCDLVLPWEESAGWLYSLEHFETARDRLRSGGQFWLWLPLYQMSEREYAVIARTFLRVFPDGEVVRGDLSRERPIVALVGCASGRLARERLATCPYYAGPLIVPPCEPRLLNTDDRPIVPYLAADSRRRGETFTGRALERYFGTLR